MWHGLGMAFRLLARYVWDVTAWKFFWGTCSKFTETTLDWEDQHEQSIDRSTDHESDS